VIDEIRQPVGNCRRIGWDNEARFVISDEMQRLAVRVVAIDVCGQLEDAGVNLVGGE